ncbi:hypothetical protein D9613_005686 [Agrocybe pediades]|uniref:Uncharacterized protein n=1 Tax=Agrocybe pediades TaxID=84607 RepID=A0A8H4QU34_9AGAR|nr:hypothetical protein D9613_005686 [Agrocybe pediades]
MEFGYQTPQSYPYFGVTVKPIFEQDSRSIPFLVSTIVLAIQLLHICVGAFKNGATRPENASVQHRIRYMGGKTIFAFTMTRLIGSGVLLGLSLYSIPGCQLKSGGIQGAVRDCPELFLTITFLYTTLLSLVSLFSTSYGTWSTRYSVVVLLAALGVYAYRDIWPLATYTQRPADIEEGVLLPIKIAVLAWIAVGIPLFIPRRYVPVDPNNAVPNVEQTASLFSMMTYTFLDHTVMLGYKVPHLSVDQLDPLSDRDAAAYRTEKAFPHIDVFRGAKRRSLFWRLMRVYRKEYTILALTIIGYSLGGFAAPLESIVCYSNYMETKGAGATIRPWFWTLWLFAGPMIQSLCFQWYIFIGTRTLVRAEGLITQLVFEHSLRIRLKAEASKVEMSPTATANQSVVVTPDNASVFTEAASEHSENTQHTAGPSQGSTAASRDSSSTSTLPTSNNQPSTKRKADSNAATHAKSEELAGDSNLIGKINNLVTTDLNNVTKARDFLMIFLTIPVHIVFCMIFLYQVLGWSSLVGIAVMIVLLPFPGYISKVLQAAQKQRMKKTDARVQAVTETVNILRMVKLFGWEQKMSERLDKTRQEELLWLWKLKLLDQVNGLFGFLYPIMTMIVTYTLYTLVMKETLTASKIFSSMTVFNLLREQFFRILRESLDVIQGKVSLERIEDFLNNTELLDAYLEKPLRDASSAPAGEATTTPSSTEIGFRNATFTWSLGTESNGTITPSRREFKLRTKDKLIFKKHGINLIIGPTGSGKTSILMALLGEMHFVPSNPDSWFNLPREGGIAYAAQESWVQNETIRNNILFRTPYDDVRYKKVIKQCALERDLELFEAGDATEVGERGLTLSGGQKARVTLARAIYSHAEILLLDDIFAALDVHTSSHIIENCFKGDLIKGRTILLVTHNIALASPIVDFIVSVGIDGRVKSQGKELSAALKHNPALKQEAEFDQEATEIGQAELDLPPTKPAEQDGKLVIAEEIAEGHVTWKSFMLLIRNLGGDHPVLFFGGLLFLLIIVEWGLTFQSWFLGYWGTQYEGRDPSEVEDGYYIGIYAALALFVFFLNFAAYMLHAVGSMRASRQINKLLIDSVLASTLRWMDETPTARIITRCTQDIRAVDSTLPQTLMWLADVANAFLTKLGAVVLFTPLFLFPGIGVGVVGFFLGNMYLKAQLSVKRETSNARSPMLAHFSAAIHGIVSIRAYGAQDTFRQESLIRIDRYTRVARMSYNLNRWISVRMDFLGAAFTSGLALYLIYGPSIGASNTGFSLAMASDIAFAILLLVRIGNEFEVNANSLERVQGYIDIEHEPKPTESGTPPASWPTSGDLRVEHLSARYSQNGPKVLNGISFHIQSGERVGIVGRTGSGKVRLSKFALDKLAVLHCTEKREPDPTRPGKTRLLTYPELTINGTAIKSVESYKYLGIQIDRRLRWTTQMQKTIAKATSYTLLFRRLTRQSTGVSAKLMRKLYLSVIIPKMTYGLDVWYTPPHKPEGKRRQTGSVKALKEFRKIQRLATLAITGAMRTTPNELLDSHAGLLPVDLLLRKICHRALIRLGSLPQTNPAGQLATKYLIAPAKTHITSIQKLTHLFQIQTHRIETINPKTEARNAKRNFTTIIAANAERAEQEERADQARAKIYTDAANHQGQLGAAAILYENNAHEPTKVLRYKLGPDTHHTIDDAESIAGLLGCWLIKGTEHRGQHNVTVYTDSQNLIKAMNSRTPYSGFHIIEAIKEISSDIAREAPNNEPNDNAQFSMRWIPAHGRSRGNNRADHEAKRAARGESSSIRNLPPLLRTSLPHSTKALKTDYLNALKREAEHRWNQSERKEKFDRDVDDRYPYDDFRKQQMKLNRAKASVLMQIRTGHLPLNTYLHRFGQHYTSRCNACYQTTRRHKEETLKHYLFECPEYRWERADMDKKMGRNSRNLKALLGCNKSVKALMEYIEKTGRLRTKQGDVPNAQARDNG